MIIRPCLLSLLATSTLSLVSLRAQMGDQRDTAGSVQKPPPAAWSLPAPALTPQEALKTFSLPPGFRVEIVASEPLIHEPIAMDFGPDGRLWVVELRSYMPDADGKGENEPINRVVVLEDTDGDGRMDKSTVYMDHLGLVRAIKVLEHGVLIGEPPNLWYTRDTNGDGKADEKIAIATDFSQAEMNPEGGGNALLWGLDNWIGGSSYGRRFKLQSGKWIDSPVTNRGQWGQGMDDYGRMYTNSNSDYLRVDLVPNHYPARNPNLIPSGRRASSGNGVNYQPDADQTVWPIRPTPGVNRGYWEGQLRANGTLKEFTAACGPTIYRGDNFPAEFYGNYFSCEPSAHVVRRSIITEKDGILSAKNAYQEKEFLSSTDERFRPVNLYTAPDGSLYLVDLYRGILQHRQFMTSYLRKQIVERGLDKNLGLGRIYRIVNEAKKPGPQPKLGQATPAQLVATLSHPNGWWRNTAQRLLVERGEKSVVPDLRKLALSPQTSEPVRLGALWTMEGLGAIDPEIVSQVMDDPSPKMRVNALRLSEPYLVSGSAKLAEGVTKHARDASPEVRLQAALSLGELGTAARDAALADLLRTEAESPFMISAAVSGLAGRELAFLERLTAAPDWREAKKGYTEVFETLGAAIAQSGDAATLDPLFRIIRTEKDAKWQRLALLNGMKTSNIRKISALPPELEAAAKASDPDIAKGASDLMARFSWPGKFGSGPLPLTAAEKELFEKGRTAFTTICAACHQPDGRGLPGIAASLVESPWATGPEQLAARIVLKGKTGKMLVAMPPLEMLPDETLAAALTYVRRSWGNEATPVSVATIAGMRRAVIVRGQPYTEKELEELRTAAPITLTTP